MTARTTERGFTLVELVVTIAVLGIALLAVAKSLQFGSRFSADPLWQSKTVALVQAYSDEILARRFDERSPIGGIPACVGIGASAGQCSQTLGPEGSEFRGVSSGVSSNSLDDVDDYHGLDEAPRDAMGLPLSEYGGYRVAVAVTYAGIDLGRDDHDVKGVTLTVTPPGQAPLVFSIYRGNF